MLKIKYSNTEWYKQQDSPSQMIVSCSARDAKRGAKGVLCPGPQGLEGPFRFQLAIVCL